MKESGPEAKARPLRILLTTPFEGRPGGVGQYLRVLKPHLNDDVDYFTVGSRSDGEGLCATAVRMFGDSARFAWRLGRGGYDLVQLNPSLSPKALVRDGLLLIIAKTLRKPVVVFTHGWDDGCRRALSAYLARPFGYVFGRADSFVVLANQFKSNLRELGYSRPVFVEGAPLEDELLRESEYRGHRTRRGGTGLKFTILFLARVEKEKGIFEALDTYRLVKQKYSFASLVVVGDGGALDGAIKYTSERQLSDVSFVGHASGRDKYEAFRSADAYLFPSYSEGLPLSVLEAIAFGVPVVTSAVGGLCDFFEEGKMGFISNSLDPKILAPLIGQLIDGPELCSRIRAFNRNYANEHFRGSQVAARLEGIYRLVLEGAH